MKNVLRPGRDRLDTIVALGLFIAAMALYLRTMAPTVTEIYDDTTELALVVRNLAIAHPTGYPLYTLLGKLFTFLPVGDFVFRLHLFAAVCAAAAVAALYLAARRMGLHPAGGLAAAVLLAVSPVFWSQALIAEVYALNALFVAVILGLAIAWGEDSRHPFALLAGLFFVLGLSLTHHRTIVLLYPALLVYMLLVLKQGGRSILGRRAWGILALLVLFCLPLLVYAYIPLRGMVTSSIDGTYRNTLEGFLTWVSGGSYTVFLTGNPLQERALSLTDYAALLRDQLGVGGLALAALGVAWLALRRRRVLLLLGTSWLVYVIFGHFYRVTDIAVFLLPSFLLAALAAGAGVHALATLHVPDLRRLLQRETAPAGNPSHTTASALFAVAAIVLTFVVAGATIRDNIYQLDLSDSWAVYNYAVDALSQPLEKGATIVGIMGEVSLLRYYQETRAMRPDIQTIGADTDSARLAAVKRLTGAGRPVYLTRTLPGIETLYALRAVGNLIEVRPGQAARSEQQPGAMPSRAVFGDSLMLLDYRLDGLSAEMQPQAYPQTPKFGIVESGGRLRVSLSWKATRPMAQSYRLTLRLKSPTNRLLWQRDAGPVHDSYPTSAWREGETVWDVHDLLVPVGTAPGLYDVEIGLYDPANLRLLPVAGSPELLTIGPVSVVRPDASMNLDSLPVYSPPAAGGMLMPGGTFDYSLQRLGVQHVVHGNLQNEFALYGYGVSGPIASGQSVDITLLWQALRPPSGDRVVFVQLVDEQGTVWASHESQPAEGTYPTRQWSRAEVIRDVHSLLVPSDVPDGEYRLEAGMYDPSGAPLTVLQLTRRSLDHVNLGNMQVRGREHVQAMPSLRYTINARLGRLARLAGYDAGANELGIGAAGSSLAAKPGDTIRLRLVWQAMEPTHTSYTVFVHLLGPDGRVVSQDDTIPGRGTLATTSWVRSEVLSDDYALLVPLTATPGMYSIEIGLYDASTDARLPVWDAQGTAVGDSLALTKVRIERAP